VIVSRIYSSSFATSKACTIFFEPRGQPNLKNSVHMMLNFIAKHQDNEFRNVDMISMSSSPKRQSSSWISSKPNGFIQIQNPRGSELKNRKPENYPEG
jgi:hypothetical protein